MSDETTIPEVEAVRSCLDRYVGDCVAADRVAGIEEEWAREDAGAGKEESGSALRAALSALETALRTARANYRFMVERAADEKLDGYRELASRLERAVVVSDALRSRLAAAETRTDEVIATLGPDVERLTGERDAADELARALQRASQDADQRERVLREERDRARALLRERAACRDCIGSGEYDGRVCHWCQGTGYPAAVWAEIGGEGE